MDVKKLFVHVKANSGVDLSKLHSAVEDTSTGSGSDRIYFLEDTNELIVKGHAYGLSTTDAARIAALETGLTKATGVTGETFTITDDSAIGQYVNAIAGVGSVDGTVKVNKTPGQAADLSVNIDGKSLVKDADGDDKGQISVGLDNIIDRATIVKDGDKIKSGLKLVYDKKGSNVDNVTLDHPQLRLVDVNNKTFGTGVDVSDFIIDGLLQDVAYNEATHTIDFTWNTDTKTEEGKAVPKTASVDISKLFNIEQLHTTTPNYLTVNTVTSNEDGHPHTGDVKGGRCFDVDAIVDSHDYDTTFALTHTPASPDGATTESYVKNANDTGTDPSKENKTVSSIKGLADAKKVANAVKYLAGQIVELGNDRIAAEKKNADAIAKKSSDARKAEKENKDAIAKLNADENTNGSVAYSIKTAIDSLDSEVKGVAAIDTTDDATKEETKLVSVKVTQTDGKLTGVAVEAKIASLVVPVNDDSKVDYKKDTISVAARGLTDSGDGAKDGIASLNPALVTLQDAWLYGQCIKAQAVKEIASDNNDYIHISRVDNQTKINFEPWTEVHTIDELKNI